MPILPPDRDPVTRRFAHLDPLPWCEIEPGHWAKVGFVDKTEVINVLVNVLRRPWATNFDAVDGAPGRLYDVVLMGGDSRSFVYPALLERTKPTHHRLAHVVLDTGATVRLTIPSILGAEAVIGIIDAWLEAARDNVRRGRFISNEAANAIAAEWPEYVLGPGHPLAVDFH